MNKVKQMRLKKRVTQEEVANLLGISCPNYGKKENEKIRFSLEEAKHFQIFLESALKNFFLKANFQILKVPAFPNG